MRETTHRLGCRSDISNRLIRRRDSERPVRPFAIRQRPFRQRSLQTIQWNRPLRKSTRVLGWLEQGSRTHLLVLDYLETATSYRLVFPGNRLLMESAAPIT